MENKEENKEGERSFNKLIKKSVLRSTGNGGVIPIRINPLPNDVKNHLMRLKQHGQMGEWIRNAMIQQLHFENHPKTFLSEIMRNNYSLCKRLLRQIGNQLKNG